MSTKDVRTVHVHQHQTLTTYLLYKEKSHGYADQLPCVQSHNNVDLHYLETSARLETR